MAPDFATVTLPQRDCALLRDLLIAAAAGTVIEVGLAYGSSALAVGAALATVGAADRRHVVIDPFQASSYGDAGWSALGDAGLHPHTTLLRDWSSIALPRLLAD